MKSLAPPGHAHASKRVVTTNCCVQRMRMLRSIHCTSTNGWRKRLRRIYQRAHLSGFVAIVILVMEGLADGNGNVSILIATSIRHSSAIRGSTLFDLASRQPRRRAAALEVRS